MLLRGHRVNYTTTIYPTIIRAKFDHLVRVMTTREDRHFNFTKIY